jgi:hypothetical protein
VKESQINNLIIIGDSKTIIGYFARNTNPKNSTLKRTIDRTRDIITGMTPCFYHIRRANNWIADDEANKAIGRGKGYLEIQGKSTIHIPP